METTKDHKEENKESGGGGGSGGASFKFDDAAAVASGSLLGMFGKNDDETKTSSSRPSYTISNPFVVSSSTTKPQFHFGAPTTTTTADSLSRSAAFTFDSNSSSGAATSSTKTTTSSFGRLMSSNTAVGDNNASVIGSLSSPSSSSKPSFAFGRTTSSSGIDASAGVFSSSKNNKENSSFRTITEATPNFTFRSASNDSLKLSRPTKKRIARPTTSSSSSRSSIFSSGLKKEPTASSFDKSKKEGIVKMSPSQVAKVSAATTVTTTTTPTINTTNMDKDKEDNDDQDSYDDDDPPCRDDDVEGTFDDIVEMMMMHSMMPQLQEDEDEDQDDEPCDCSNCRAERRAKEQAVLEYQRQLQEEDEDDDDPNAAQCAICFSTKKALVNLPCCGGDAAAEDTSTMRFCRECLCKTFERTGLCTSSSSMMMSIGECPRCKDLICLSCNDDGPIERASVEQSIRFVFHKEPRLQSFLFTIAHIYPHFIPVDLMEGCLSESRLPSENEEQELTAAQIQEKLKLLVRCGILDVVKEGRIYQLASRTASAQSDNATQRAILSFVTREEHRPQYFEDHDDSFPFRASRAPILDEAKWRSHSWCDVAGDCLYSSVHAISHFHIMAALRLFNQGMIACAKSRDYFETLYQSPLLAVLNISLLTLVLMIVLFGGTLVGLGYGLLRLLSWYSRQIRSTQINVVMQIMVLHLLVGRWYLDLSWWMQLRIRLLIYGTRQAIMWNWPKLAPDVIQAFCWFMVGAYHVLLLQWRVPTNGVEHENEKLFIV